MEAGQKHRAKNRAASSPRAATGPFSDVLNTAVAPPASARSIFSGFVLGHSRFHYPSFRQIKVVFRCGCDNSGADAPGSVELACGIGGLNRGTGCADNAMDSGGSRSSADFSGAN